MPETGYAAGSAIGHIRSAGSFGGEQERKMRAQGFGGELEMGNDKFDEYKFFVESTQHLSERRQAATQTYLTINTAIFAVLALLVKETGLKGWYLVGVGFPLFLVGVLVCWIWYKIITQYKALIGWRYDQIMIMERAMSGSYQIYVKEWEQFFMPKQEKEKFGFSRLEVWLPRLFMALYAMYATGLIIAVTLK